jgi:hypothetical protein
VNGTPVVNVVIVPQLIPVDILRSIYSAYNPLTEFMPFGVLFRTGFARSLATDKRDIAALVRDRGIYYSMDTKGNFFGAELPKGGEPIITKVLDTSVIKCIEPPKPRSIRIKE